MRFPIFVLAISALVLASCSDDSTTPTPSPANYVVSTPGSYFLHANTTVDITAAGIITESEADPDSSVVTGTKTYSGRSAVETVRYVNGVVADTVYLSQSGSKVSSAFPLAFTVLGAPVDFGVRWVDVYDSSVDSWTALNDTIPSFTINAGPSSYNGSAKLLFTGKKTGTENIIVDGKTLSANKAELTLNITLYLQFSASVVVPVPIVLVQRSWMVPDVGLVRAEQDAKVVSIMGVPPLPIPGFKTVLTKYNVVK